MKKKSIEELLKIKNDYLIGLNYMESLNQLTSSMSQLRKEYIKKINSLEQEINDMQILNDQKNIQREYLIAKKQLEKSIVEGCYYVKKEESFNVMNSTMSVGLSQIIATMFLIQNNKENKYLTFEELEKYSEIVNRELKVQKIYEDELIMQNEYIKIYENPVNNFSYVYKDSLKRRQQLKRDVENNYLDISPYIEVENDGLVLKKSEYIDILQEKYKFAINTNQRVIEALVGEDALKLLNNKKSKKITKQKIKERK